MEKLITVIVPVYNIKAYLPRCVHSICGQTYRNLEIILVDDGSTDGTGDLVDVLAQEDSRIRVFHKVNGGSSSARNLALQHAKGDYIGFVDSDDYIEPDMYEKLLEAIEKSGMPIAQGAREEIDEKGNRLPDICIPPEETLVYSSVDFMRELLMHKGDCSFCTKLTDRRLFAQGSGAEGTGFTMVRFPEGALNEDFHVLVKLLPHIEGIVSIPKRTYHVFYKSGSNTRVTGKNAFSRVYGDNVDNADMVEAIVQQHYPQLMETAKRFGFYQRLDYLLHVPTAQMNGENKQYRDIVAYLRREKQQWQNNPLLSDKEKKYLEILSTCPALARRSHALLMKLRGR